MCSKRTITQAIIDVRCYLSLPLTSLCNSADPGTSRAHKFASRISRRCVRVVPGSMKSPCAAELDAEPLHLADKQIKVAEACAVVGDADPYSERAMDLGRRRRRDATLLKLLHDLIVELIGLSAVVSAIVALRVCGDVTKGHYLQHHWSEQLEVGRAVDQPGQVLSVLAIALDGCAELARAVLHQVCPHLQCSEASAQLGPVIDRPWAAGC